MPTELTRRAWLATSATAVAASVTTSSTARAADRPKDEPFGYCLNTSTLMGQKLPITEEAAIASKAGYHGIEPWIRELDDYTKKGGSLSDLGKKLADLNLSVESAIGFFEWAVDDEGRRKKALDEARRNFEMVRAIGGKRLAAPPSGATGTRIVDLSKLAERYRALIELGDEFGVVPEVEVWGPSKTLGRLGEAAMIAIDSGHPKACILPDVFHLYKGGSSFQGLRLLSGSAIGCFHFNDYPASPPRSEVNDSMRVYPGDGVAPLGEVIRALRDIGYKGMLSIELFNREYWKQDATTVARTGIEKLRAVVRRSLA
ncbi:MAG TPA: sugar phosphate isomerase/epimerase [Isosphaeraceae bacterium]|nr:sugar phosphate isomerase/epimerase [Isosphaeraceae bacterium]